MDNNKSASKMVSNRQLEFSGHIGNINISDDGIHYQFDLVNNKKVRKAYMLSTANLTGFAAMASLIASAYMVGKKIHVSGEANADGLLRAVTIRVGAKSKAPKGKRLKPPVLINDAVVAVDRATHSLPN